MKMLMNRIDGRANERWNQVEEQLTRGVLFFGAIFIAIGLGEFLFVAINGPRLAYGSGGFSAWQIVLCLLVTVYFAVRVRDPELRIAALAFVVSFGLSLARIVHGSGPTMWIVENVYLVVMGAIFVVVGKKKNGPKAKIAALLLCLGMLAFKYFMMMNAVRIWERYHTS
jgi:hypothetical protein